MDVLRKLQLTQLEILRAIDQFCKENNIVYSLYAGTLLGAVRHQGFIPWDDDLDICMPREDYERFLKLWPQHHPKGYTIQNKDNEPRFTQSFTKVRKDHTTFLQETDPQNAAGYHTGIFVDIFPIDRIPSGVWERSLFVFRCMRYQLFMREFVPPKGNVLEKAVSRAILALVPAKARPARRRKLLKKLTKYNTNTKLNRVGIETMSSLREPLDSDWLDHFINLRFEDGEFSCGAGWKDYLNAKFGDYMKLPPEAEREPKHNGKIIDFERNIEEIPPEELYERMNHTAISKESF